MVGGVWGYSVLHGVFASPRSSLHCVPRPDLVLQDVKG